MKYLLSLLLMTTFIPQLALASPCAKSYRNCSEPSADLMYLYTTRVCKLTAWCDVYCGEMLLARNARKPFYCGFQTDQGKPNTCMKLSLCMDDASVVKSDEDVANLTYQPRSPGPGLVIPQDRRSVR